MPMYALSLLGIVRVKTTPAKNKSEKTSASSVFMENTSSCQNKHPVLPIRNDDRGINCKCLFLFVFPKFIYLKMEMARMRIFY